MTKRNSEAWSKLLLAGFVSMDISAFVLLLQGELLLMFGAIIMALACYQPLAKQESK